MAPKKRGTNPVKSRCKIVKDAISQSECNDRVKEMLTTSIPVTIGAIKANRHSLNERFVGMIGEVLKQEHERMQKRVQELETAFADLEPAKSKRQEEAEKASAEAEVKAKEFEDSKVAISEAAAELKEKVAAVKEAEKTRKAGEDVLAVLESKKSKLEEVRNGSLAPLLSGSAEDQKTKTKAVLDIGKEYLFDASLLQTAEPVLQKPVPDRGAFDATCLEQLEAAFAGAVTDLENRIIAGNNDAAVAAFEATEAAKQAAEAKVAESEEKSQAAKDARHAAKAAEKAANQSLQSFMPDLKAAGDSLDNSKENLQTFEAGALKVFEELKDLTEDSFKEELHADVANPEAAQEGTAEEAKSGEQEDILGSPAKKARISS